MNLRQSLVAVLCAGAVSVFSAAATAQTKIAVVDTQRAVMETEEGLRAKATLKKLFDSRQRQLDSQQTALKKERAEIEKQSKVLSREALQKRLEKWQQEMMKLQAVFVEYNKELQKKQGELTQPIFRKAMGIIRRLATQEGFDAVVDKQAVPYVRGDLDLTDRVIILYNQGGAVAPSKPAESKKAPAAKPAASASKE